MGKADELPQMCLQHEASTSMLMLMTVIYSLQKSVRFMECWLTSEEKNRTVSCKSSFLLPSCSLLNFNRSVIVFGNYSIAQYFHTFAFNICLSLSLLSLLYPSLCLV